MIGVEKLAWGHIKPDVLFLIDRQTPLRDEPADEWPLWKGYYSELFNTEGTQYPCHRIENEETIDQATRRMQEIWRTHKRS